MLKMPKETFFLTTLYCQRCQNGRRAHQETTAEDDGESRTMEPIGFITCNA